MTNNPAHTINKKPPIEIETKIIDINPSEVRKRLKLCGATFIKKINYRILTINKYEAKSRKKTIRIRTDGQETTITLKDRSPFRKHPYEYETTIASFETCAKIISIFIGELEYSEKTREIYTLGRATIVIDKYKDLPYYMEIEAPTEEHVKMAYEKLGRPGKQFGNFSTGELYKHYGFTSKKKTYVKKYGIVLKAPVRKNKLSHQALA